MRQAMQILFLVFYVASTYAIGQERTNLIVSELQHSRCREDQTQFKDGCKQLEQGFPTYRHAKPRTIGFQNFPGSRPFLCPPGVVERRFHVQPDSLKPIRIAYSILSRAPPSQA